MSLDPKPPAVVVAEMLDYVERRLDVYLDGGPDPRGPAGLDPRTMQPIWPTRPLWAMGELTRRLGEHAIAIGDEAGTIRARTMLRWLHGRAQSPEELVAMIAATGELAP